MRAVSDRLDAAASRSGEWSNDDITLLGGVAVYPFAARATASDAGGQTAFAQVGRCRSQFQPLPDYRHYVAFLLSLGAGPDSTLGALR
jgi:hypothetical protein